MIPGRPVVRRASFSAPSIASEPEFMNRTLSSGSGNVAASRRASSTVGSLKPIAWTGPISRSTCAWIAAVTRGCAWPSDVTAIPLAKSRYSRPAVSYSRWPIAVATSCGPCTGRAPATCWARRGPRDRGPRDRRWCPRPEYRERQARSRPASARSGARVAPRDGGGEDRGERRPGEVGEQQQCGGEPDPGERDDRRDQGGNEHDDLDQRQPEPAVARRRSTDHRRLRTSWPPNRPSARSDARLDGPSVGRARRDERPRRRPSAGRGPSRPARTRRPAASRRASTGAGTTAGRSRW